MTDQHRPEVPPIPLPQHPIEDPPVVAAPGTTAQSTAEQAAAAQSAPAGYPPPPVAPQRPAYGEYAPAPPAPPAVVPIAQTPYGVQNGALPAYPGSARPLRTGDVVASCILLFLGIVGTLIAVFTAAILPEVVQQVLDDQNLGTTTAIAGVGAGQATLVISHVVLLLIAVGLSVLLMVKHRISFYVPLAAGVLAAIFYWVTFIAVFASDPALVSNV